MRKRCLFWVSARDVNRPAKNSIKELSRFQPSVGDLCRLAQESLKKAARLRASSRLGSADGLGRRGEDACRHRRWR